MRWAPGLRDLGWLLARPAAHRGLHDRTAGIVENTAGAFAAALAHGYAIECDLQQSADGEAVVFHDATLDRLTAASGRLIERTAAQLKQVRFKESRERMQTLPELLEQVAGRTCLLLEVKSRWCGMRPLVERVAGALAQYRGPAAVMSFDPEVVHLFRSIAPSLARGIVADRMSLRDWPRLPVARRISLRRMAHLRQTLPHFLSYDVAALPGAPARAFRCAGGPVLCWTVRSAEQASRALRYADQITFEGFHPGGGRDG